MEIANFLGKLKGKDSSEPKKFLALILTDEVVQASVWSVIDEQTEIVAIGSPVEWDGDTGTTSELITAVDATISSAVEGVGDEPNEVILGIPSSWTDKNGVLGVKKEFINKIRKELDLVALGYVEITASVLSYLKMQEGTPTTSILIQVSRDELTIVLVRLGRIEASENIGRSDDIVEDVTEGIARFKIVDNLPSRIILFNSMHNLDEIIQNLLSVDWQTQFNFLHIPKIEALGKDVAIRALSVAGGSEVARSLGISTSLSQTVSQPEEVEESNVTEVEGVLEESSELPDESIEEVDDEVTSEEDTSELVSAQEIGFSSAKVDFIDEDDTVELDSVVEPPEAELVLKKQRPSFVMPKFALPKMHLPTFKFNHSGPKRYLWLVGGGILAFGLLLFWLIWLLPSTIVTISVVPRNIDEELGLTLSSIETDVNFANRIVPASIVALSESGEKMIETTGKKIVGDPAKGEVTIYNRTTAVKTFAKGTTLSSGSLKYTLNQDVQVASSSTTTNADLSEVKTPGKATVPISAAAIGETSNLAAGSEFTIMSFGKDSYVAKNDSAISGGTSEEVQVVGKEDQASLVNDLTSELLLSLTGTSEQDSESGTGIYLMENTVKVDSVEYSAKVGEAAKNLKVEMTISVSMLKYKTDDVTNLVNSSIDQAVPTGYVRANIPSKVDLSASVVDEKGESVKGTAKVQVALLPVINIDNLQQSIKGKKGLELEAILKSSVPGYIGADIRVLPSWIPSRFKSIALNPKQITVHITPAL